MTSEAELVRLAEAVRVAAASVPELQDDLLAEQKWPVHPEKGGRRCPLM